MLIIGTEHLFTKGITMKIVSARNYPSDNEVPEHKANRDYEHLVKAKIIACRFLLKFYAG